MGQLKPTPFLGGAYLARSRILNAQRCINLYPELVETKDGKEVGGLFGTPGMALLATIGAGPIRALHVFNGALYVVSGAQVFRVSTAYSAHLIGTLTSVSG